MLSKRYKSTKVLRRPLLNVPSRTQWSNTSDTHQVVEIKKRLLLRCEHHFKSDVINNMDHMRISVNEPSSVMLSQIKWFQNLKTIARKCQNKLKSKGMVKLTLKNYNFNQFYTENVDALITLHINQMSP